MSTQKIIKLIERLEFLTDNEKIDWQETPQENRFQASFSEFSVRISQEFDGEDGTTFYCIDLLNDKGRKLETTTDWMLREDLTNSTKRLSDLYNKARSIGLGVEQALDNILLELDKKEKQ